MLNRAFLHQATKIIFVFYMIICFIWINKFLYPNNHAIDKILL